MSDQSQPPASATGKAWYLKWWVWLIAAAVVIGGIGALVNPEGNETSAPAPEPSQNTPPTEAETPTDVAPLDLEAFLTESGVAFESAEMSARKAYIYVPTETTNEQAQQIANDTMLHICDHAVQAGDSAPAANRVEVSDGVSPATPGYNANEHPSGFATDELCEG
ncbi:hypothetical protein [Microbacterium hominis]|uniref:hypothetical protein n=1 Tax=Microbacterium hominis TaxID=162426 RepID=UPI0007687E1B|nr:hypothetical protein [Microbacterium hominis]KXC06434.1 hypothetical protein MhomT_05725 [Microbacterium hominis]